MNITELNTVLTKIDELNKSNNLLINKITEIDKTLKELILKTTMKTTTNFNEQLVTLGPRLQKINPDTLNLIKVYDSVTECIKEDPKIKRASINKAINENTIYHGFRWLLVDRNLDCNIIHSIVQTKSTKIQNLGYIAKLDRNKSKILNVYLNRKSASFQNNYPSAASLDNVVKNNKLSNGYYYMLYEQCDNKIKEEYEKENGNPILYQDGIGQFDINNNLIKEFSSIYDCRTQLGISDKSIMKAIEKNIIYNNHYYKRIGTKIVHLVN